MKVVDEENSNKSFDGKVVVLRGEFRQIMFVDTKGSRYDIVKAAITFLNYENIANFLNF